MIPVGASGQVLRDEYSKLLNDCTKIVVVTQVSNALGILRRFSVETTVRPSLAFYNTFDEIDCLTTVVRRLAVQRR